MICPFQRPKSSERMTTAPPPPAVCWVRRQNIPQEAQMKKTILTFGLISGVLFSLMIVASLPSSTISASTRAILRLHHHVFAFLLVFFGIRSYRDNTGNGQLPSPRHFRRHLDYSDLVRLLCRYVGNYLLQFPSGFHGQIRRPHDRQAPGLWRECRRHPDTDSATEDSSR